MKKHQDPKKVITGPNTVMDWLTVIVPKIPKWGGPPRYGVSLIIPKADTETYGRLQFAMRAAYEEGLAKLQGDGGAVPDFVTLRKPLRDGDLEEPGRPACRDSWVIAAHSFSKPGVVDANLQPITDPDELYSGIIGRASISFFAYAHGRERGIGCGLNNLQKLRDGEPLDHRMSAVDEFGGLEDTEDEDSKPF